MFKNIGKKIKTLAKVLFWIEFIFGTLASIAAGIEYINAEKVASQFTGSSSSSGAAGVVGIIIMIVGAAVFFLVAWLSTIILFAFGECTDQLMDINQKLGDNGLEPIHFQLNGISQKLNMQGGGYAAPASAPVASAPASNMVSGPCPHCKQVVSIPKSALTQGTSVACPKCGGQISTGNS